MGGGRTEGWGRRQLGKDRDQVMEELENHAEECGFSREETH